MTTVAAIFGVWLLASIPFGILIGRFMANGQGHDLSEYVIVPDDRSDR